MWMVWLLWLTLVFGGLFMGLGGVRVLLAEGFDLALVLNVVLYLGCSFYAMPKLYRLVFTRSSS